MQTERIALKAVTEMISTVVFLFSSTHMEHTDMTFHSFAFRKATKQIKVHHPSPLK